VAIADGRDVNLLRRAVGVGAAASEGLGAGDRAGHMVEPQTDRVMLRARIVHALLGAGHESCAEVSCYRPGLSLEMA